MMDEGVDDKHPLHGPSVGWAKMPFIKETFECDACKCTMHNVAFIIHKVNVLDRWHEKEKGQAT